MALKERREYLSTATPDGKFEVASDGRTVWINGGICLARFCPISHEFLSVSSDQGNHPELTIRHSDEKSFSSYWDAFVAGVKTRWEIEVGSEHKPLYV